MTIPSLYLFFFTATSTTEIYTLSLHDALPISPPRRRRERARRGPAGPPLRPPRRGARPGRGDRKSTRLNSSHVEISYAVFCLKKKKQAEAGYRLSTCRRRLPTPRRHSRTSRTN